MDDISRLLRMARLRADLDKRCLLGGSTRMEVAYGEREVPFHVLLDGECDLEVEGRLHRMTAGDVVVLPSGARHRIITDGPAPLQPTGEVERRAFTLTSSADGAAPVIDLFCGHYTVSPGAGSILFASLPTPLHVSLYRSEDGRATLTQLSALMRREADSESAGAEAIMSALCTVLIALVLRTSTRDGAHGRVWTAEADSRMGAVIEAVLADPGDDWTIDRLSALALTSRATFFRHFQAATGMTVGRFLARARMMAATESLLSSGDTVAVVASRVGYRSEAAFTRAFRAELGTTPSRFRRSHAGPAEAPPAL